MTVACVQPLTWQFTAEWKANPLASLTWALHQTSIIEKLRFENQFPYRADVSMQAIEDTGAPRIFKLLKGMMGVIVIVVIVNFTPWAGWKHTVQPTAS